MYWPTNKTKHSFFDLDQPMGSHMDSENRWVKLAELILWEAGGKRKKDRKQEYKDNTDRTEVERSFSLGKQCYGMGLIVTKLEQT